MRSRLENSSLSNPFFKTGTTEEIVALTITGTYTIGNTNPSPMYSLSAASGQNVVLPAPPGGNLSLKIRVRAAGAGTLTVQDPGGGSPTTVVALTTGQTGEYFSIGTGWHGGVVGTA